MGKGQSADELIQDALSRSLADPAPRPMHGTAANPGIFRSSAAAAKAAAEQALARGLLRQAGEQRKGQKLVPLYAVSPAGVAYLLEHAEAPKLLAAALDALERSARAVADCSRSVEELSRQLAGLRQVVEQAAARCDPQPLAARLLGKASDSTASTLDASAVVEQCVQGRRADRSAQPYSLPELYRDVARQQPSLTIGRLHDVLRKLAANKRVRLLPFTQALYQLSEPEYALIVGREIMFYVEAV